MLILSFVLLLQFLKHKQANINVKSRRFGIIMTRLLMFQEIVIDQDFIAVLRQKKIILMCQGLFEHIPFADSTMPTLGSVPLLFLPVSFRPHPLPQEDT